MVGAVSNSSTFIEDPSWGHLVMLDTAPPSVAGIYNILEGDPRVDVVIAIRPFANPSRSSGGEINADVPISRIRDWIEEVISFEVILAFIRCVAAPTIWMLKNSVSEIADFGAALDVMFHWKCASPPSIWNQTLLQCANLWHNQY